MCISLYGNSGIFLKSLSGSLEICVSYIDWLSIALRMRLPAIMIRDSAPIFNGCLWASMSQSSKTNEPLKAYAGRKPFKPLRFSAVPIPRCQAGSIAWRPCDHANSRNSVASFSFPLLSWRFVNDYLFLLSSKFFSFSLSAVPNSREVIQLFSFFMKSRR